MTDALVSTALRDTWPRNGRAFFFGNWCWAGCETSTQSAPKSVDGHSALTVPYHWDDRVRFARDAAYLERLVARVRRRIGDLLNEHHSTDHPQRYWDIFTGWWALYFTHIYWDRWQTVREATTRFPGLPLICRDTTTRSFAPQERGEFFVAFQDDPWNERLFGEIAEQIFGVTVTRPTGVESFGYAPDHLSTNEDLERHEGLSLARRTARGIGRLSVFRSQRVSLQADYLPRTGRLKLDLALHQWPQSRALPRYAGPWIDPQPRDLHLAVGETDFESALGTALVQHMPVAYLEGYDHYLKALEGLALPRSPKVIATATGHYESDLYSLWVASRVEEGARLFVLQHGGSYGLARINSALDHDKAVADQFLSWGWSEAGVTPAPATKLIEIRPTPHNGLGPLVLTLTDVTRYSNWMASQPMPSQQIDVIRIAFRLLAALDERIVAQTVARVNLVQNGWQVRERLQEQFPMIGQSDNDVGYVATIQSARVVVCTDNSTTMIESFAAGQPTIVLWDPLLNELSERGEEAITRLRDANIFFDDPERAARHLNAIWEDISGWWSLASVQVAVGEFLTEFGHVGKHPYGRLASAMLAPHVGPRPTSDWQHQVLPSYAPALGLDATLLTAGESTGAHDGSQGT